jgi:hypothetical protein
MKKLLLVLLFVPLVSFGQTNNVNITAGEPVGLSYQKSIAEANKEEGNFYLGKGKYKIVQVGSTAFISMKN